jgi:CRP/FNR family transcriptional regulator, cyclic AMP receptor protein
MQTRKRVALLRESELFSQLDDDELHKLAQRAGYLVFEEGGSIFVQGELGARFFIIADGVVKIFVRSREGASIELDRLTRPSVVGELAVLDGGERSASAEAVERTVLLYLTREDLDEVLLPERLFVDALLRRLAGIVRRTTSDLAALAFLDVERRVARQLLVGKTVGKSQRVTQTELGHMVGGTRQAVNRALSRLKNGGYIRLTDGAIEITNREGLRQRAADD